MTVAELLVDALDRRSYLEAALSECKQQAFAINARGVDLEKQMLGVAGEIKALTAAGAIDG